MLKLTTEEAKELYETLRHWSSYVDDYFTQKWELAADLERAREILGLEEGQNEND